MNDSQKHPLQNYSEKEKVPYLSILASLASVNNEFSESKKQTLDCLIKELQLSSEGKSKVYSSIHHLNSNDKNSYIKTLCDLDNKEIKFSLISDLCSFALSDSNISDKEYVYIRPKTSVKYL